MNEVSEMEVISSTHPLKVSVERCSSHCSRNSADLLVEADFKQSQLANQISIHVMEKHQQRAMEIISRQDDV